jgi:hypothetical protein
MSDKEIAKTTPATDDGWTTVAEETGSRIIFDTVGDTFTGIFRTKQHIVPENTDKEEFDLLTFTGEDGEAYSTAPGYKLTRAFDNIKPGTTVRITLKALIPTDWPQPMKDFRVETR